MLNRCLSWNTAPTHPPWAKNKAKQESPTNNLPYPLLVNQTALSFRHYPLIPSCRLRGFYKQNVLVFCIIWSQFPVLAERSCSMILKYIFFFSVITVSEVFQNKVRKVLLQVWAYWVATTYIYLGSCALECMRKHMHMLHFKIQPATGRHFYSNRWKPRPAI